MGMGTHSRVSVMTLRGIAVQSCGYPTVASHACVQVHIRAHQTPRHLAWRGGKGAHGDVLLGVPKLVLDEGDVRAGALRGGGEGADVSGERGEEGRERGRGRARWVGGDEPGRPGGWDGADLRCL